MTKLPAKVNLVNLLLILLPIGLVVAGLGYYFTLYGFPDISFLNTPAPQAQEQEEAPDTRELEIEVIKPKRTIANPTTEVSVISNKEIEFAQHNRIQTEYIGEEDEFHYYIVTVINIPHAGTEVTLKINDEVGNEFKQKLDIERQSIVFPPGLTAITPWPDSKYILDANKLDITLNRSNRLREDYEPMGIVNLNKEFGLYTLNNAKLRPDAAGALNSMIKDLRRELGNSDITIVSGYRSYETQVVTYAGHVRSSGEKRANEISARPGHSEHQLGTAVDFAKPSQNYSLEKFAESKEYEWLKEAAAEYGFRQLDDPDYIEEPWHFRYVGVEE